jgi:hypothetical protein
MSSLSRLLPALPGFTALSHRPTPPTSPASPTAAARPPPSAAGPPPSATTTKDGRPRATDRQRGREGCPARHPPDHRQRQARQGAGDRGPDRPDGDLTEVPDGLRILIRRSKGDQEGQGAEIATPRHGNARGTPHQRQSNAGHMDQCTRAANGPGHGAVIARQGSRSAPRVHCRGLASCNVGMRRAISAA